MGMRGHWISKYEPVHSFLSNIVGIIANKWIQSMNYLSTKNLIDETIAGAAVGVCVHNVNSVFFDDDVVLMCDMSKPLQLKNVCLLVLNLSK